MSRCSPAILNRRYEIPLLQRVQTRCLAVQQLRQRVQIVADVTVHTVHIGHELPFVFDDVHGFGDVCLVVLDELLLR